MRKENRISRKRRRPIRRWSRSLPALATRWCRFPSSLSAQRWSCLSINPAVSSPPVRERVAADAERKQDFAEAQATYQALVAVFSGLVYELVTLPLASDAERVRFVRAAIEREES